MKQASVWLLHSRDQHRRGTAQIEKIETQDKLSSQVLQSLVVSISRCQPASPEQAGASDFYFVIARQDHVFGDMEMTVSDSLRQLCGRFRAPKQRREKGDVK